jgi:response regulator RpfG family c-di-GMP phosphodiesterase
MTDKDNPPRTRILVAEDDPAIAAIVQQGLEGLGYVVVGPFGAAEEVLEILPKLDPKPDVVLMDINLSGPMDGIEAAEVIHREYGLPIVYASALHDEPTLRRASKAEPFGYIVKPYQIRELRAAIATALYKGQRDRERQEILEKTVGGSIQTLTDILCVVEPHSFGLTHTLKEHILTLAAALDIRSTWELEAAALLAPIGHVMVPPTILQRHRLGASLNQTEQAMIQRSPEFGSELLKRIPRLESVAQIVLYQDKNYDGTGFPHDAVAGLDLPLGARMLVVLGDFLRMAESGLNTARVIEKMRAAKGRYDLNVLEHAITSVIDAPPKGAQALNLAELRVGHTLQADVESEDGILLVAAGARLTTVLLQRLHNFMEHTGLKEPIYVESRPGAG